MMLMGGHKANRSTAAVKTHLQRCAVQVRYTVGGRPGKWFSHGRYIERSSANPDNRGFDAVKDSGVPIAHDMAAWRRERDPLFFRLIISPERGEALDLKEFTRAVMEAAEKDLGTKLQWEAVAHFNTDYPHVHVVLRGNRDDGTDLRIPAEYVKEGFRRNAEQLATLRLGPRSHDDIIAGQKREVTQMRFTTLDRRLIERGPVIRLRQQAEMSKPLERATEHHLLARLRTLERIGLAFPQEPDIWQLSIGLERSLRAKQRVHDRVKIIAEHGVLASDARMQFEVLKLRALMEVEGRILVHGQNEFSGSNYMLLESIDGKILQLSHTKEIAEARHHGNLEPGSYIRLVRTNDKDFAVTDYGEAVRLLGDPWFLDAHALRLQDRVSGDWSGWLGDFQKAIKQRLEPRQQV
jgi:hypothetical protein